MIYVNDILSIMNELYPESYSEEWDRSGLQIGDPNAPVKRISIALESTQESVNEAIRQKADVLLTHHPLFLTPLHCIDRCRFPGTIIFSAFIKSLHILSFHTQVDMAPNGLNDYVLKKLGEFSNIYPLILSVSPSVGSGRIARFKKPVEINEFKKRIESIFVHDILRFAIPETVSEISTIALCTGSGTSFTDSFLASEADIFLTGDVKYHTAVEVLQQKKGIIDIGHFGSECFFVPMISEALKVEFQKRKIDVSIGTFEGEKSPFLR